MTEYLGRVTIGRVRHVRYLTATCTPCGVESVGQWRPDGKITCDVCARVAGVWDVIDRRQIRCAGNRASYNTGCRCDECRKANSVFSRSWRRSRKERLAA